MIDGVKTVESRVIVVVLAALTTAVLAVIEVLTTVKMSIVAMMTVVSKLPLHFKCSSSSQAIRENL